MLESLEARVIQLIALVENGRFLEAIQQFYAVDAVMRENEGLLRAGLAALLAAERKALASFKEMHIIHAESHIVGGDRAAINWLFEYTGVDGKRHRLNEIAYQHWRDGKIVDERFYYDPAQRLIDVDSPAAEAVAVA
jgi:hypothetical protein